MKKLTILLFTLFFNQIWGSSNVPQILNIQCNVNNEFVFSIEHEFHVNYGLKYPITYQFEVPNSTLPYMVFFKYKNENQWLPLEEKSSSEFFNGINAVRFDYENLRAYVSIGFSNVSDSIYLKITDTYQNYLRIKFQEICKYYDNRRGVVIVTADDLLGISPGFQKAINEFRQRKLWLSCAAVTSRISEDEWLDIQEQVDLGYIEIDSHSRTHPHTPYEDYESEIIGSRDDIISNLILPELYSSGQNEYVYAYIYPYGNYTNTLDRTAGNGNYLICRKVTPGISYLTEWDEDFNLFDRVGVVYEVGANYDGVPGISNLQFINEGFDEVINDGEIYHFSIHPNTIEAAGDWEEGYIQSHLDYISGKTNVWYVGFGHLYLYQLFANQECRVSNYDLELKVFLQGAYLSENVMFASAEYSLPKIQPFSADSWNYQGIETVNHFNPDVVDWVLVELLDSQNQTAIVSRRAGLLLINGEIKDLDAISPLTFPVNPNKYYIKINHRNHLQVISSEPIYLGP